MPSQEGFYFTDPNESVWTLQPKSLREVMEEAMSDQASEEQSLHDLARLYHARCDAYDRMTCTARSPRSGEPMPANGYELGLVNKNARSVINEIIAQTGITEAKLHQAIVRLESMEGDH